MAVVGEGRITWTNAYGKKITLEQSTIPRSISLKGKPAFGGPPMPVDIENTSYKQYVVTLARLLDTRRRTEDEDTHRQVDIAIRKMKESVEESFGFLVWEAVEGDANETLQQGERNQYHGLILPS